MFASTAVVMTEFQPLADHELLCELCDNPAYRETLVNRLRSGSAPSELVHVLRQCARAPLETPHGALARGVCIDAGLLWNDDATRREEPQLALVRSSRCSPRGSSVQP